MAKKAYPGLKAEKIEINNTITTWKARSGCIAGTVGLYIIDGVPGTCDREEDDYIYSWASPYPVDD